MSQLTESISKACDTARAAGYKAGLLAGLDAASRECINCQDIDPEEREELTQETGHGWCDAHKALRAHFERTGELPEEAGS